MDACGGDLTHVLRQASPLTVSQLKILHNVLESDSEPWNQLFAATACVCFASTQEADGPMHNMGYTLNARSKQAAQVSMNDAEEFEEATKKAAQALTNLIAILSMTWKLKTVG